MRRSPRTPTAATSAPSAPPAEREAGFQAAVIEYAHLRKWLVFHSYDSRRDPAGLPDLVLCRPPRLVMAELKTAKGRLRDAQWTWLVALSACPGVETYTWRPANWPDIERILA